MSGSAAGVWACLIGILALGLGLRFLRLGHESLWLDEAVSWRYAQLPLRVLWTEGLDIHPPLYYSLLNLWLNFGDSPSSLRSISAFGGAVAVIPAFALGKQIGGNGTGLVAALLVATSALQLQYGQDARSYALLSTAALAAGAGFLGFFYPASTARRQRLWWGALYAGSMVACLYLHNVSVLLFMVCLGLGSVESLRRRSRSLAIGWLLVNLCITGVWGWWLPIVLAQTAAGLSRLAWLAPPSYGTVIATARAIYGEPYELRFQPRVDLLCLLLGLCGIFAIRRRPLVMLFFVAVAFGIPAAEVAISLLKQPIFMLRTVEWLAPFFLVLMAAALTWLPRPAAMLALVGILAVGAMGLKNYFETDKNEPWREIADRLDRDLCPGDLVLLEPFYLEPAVAYYLRDRPAGVSVVGLRRADEGEPDRRLWPLATGTVRGEAATIAAAPRVWTVSRSDDALAAFFGARLTSLLDSDGFVERVQSRGFVILRLYVHPTGLALPHTPARSAVPETSSGRMTCADSRLPRPLE
jgi:mannosyltransferase